MTTSSEKSEDKETEKKISDAYNLAKGFMDEDKRIKALETTQKTISDHGENKFCSAHHELQGDIFFELASKTDITDIKCLYLVASAASYSTSTLLCPAAVSSFYGYARSLLELGDHLRINKFYKLAVSKAKRGLLLKLQETSQSKDLEKKLETLMNLATEKMNIDVAAMTSEMVNPGNKQEVKVHPYLDRFKKIWSKLDENTKREFMVVDLAKLIEYIQNNYGHDVKKSFRKILVEAYRKYHWRWWKCHVCGLVNYCLTDCKSHIFDNHINKFEPQFSARPKCVDKVLADMIHCGEWEPVDTEAAANLIKGRTESGEEFVYVNGWCGNWPVANDEDRKNVLKLFAQVLKSSCPNENDTLSCSLWDWLIEYTEANLILPGVSGDDLDKCGFFKSPQCICFLDVEHLAYIFNYFRELTTDVRISIVSTVANRFLEKSLVKERIDLERLTFNLLLDERLLYEGEHQFDDVGTLRTFASSGIYEHVIPTGDGIVSWVLDCPEIDKNFVSQMADGINNLEMWLAALRTVQGITAEKELYCAKREKLSTYAKMLDDVETICVKEDNRKNDNLRRTYASMLRIKCEKLVKQEDAKICFLYVVRDVLEGVKSPRFDVLEDKDYMELISKLSTTVPNDLVKESLVKLRNSLKEKFVLFDSKLLLNEYTFEKLHEFPKLSAVENRLAVLPFLKMFLQEKLKKMMKTHHRPTLDAERDPKKVCRQTK